MQRIEGATATKDNKFTEGSIEDNTSGTIVTADFLNAIQEEICNVIEHDGVKLDKNDNKQLNNVIEKRINVVSEAIKISHSALLNYYNSLKYYLDNTTEIAKKIKNTISSDDNNSNIVADSKSINLKSSVINFVADSLKWDKRASDPKDLVNKEYLDFRNLRYLAFISNWSSITLRYVNKDSNYDAIKNVFEREYNNGRIYFKREGDGLANSFFKSNNSIVSYNNNKNGLVLNKDGYYLFNVTIDLYEPSHFSSPFNRDSTSDFDLQFTMILLINKANSDYIDNIIKDRYKMSSYLPLKSRSNLNTTKGNKEVGNHFQYSLNLFAKAKKDEEFSIALRIDSDYDPRYSYVSMNYIVDVKVEYFEDNDNKN